MPQKKQMMCRSPRTLGHDTQKNHGPSFEISAGAFPEEKVQSLQLQSCSDLIAQSQTVVMRGLLNAHQIRKYTKLVTAWLKCPLPREVYSSWTALTRVRE